MAGYNLICCIVNVGNASRVMKYARKYGVKGGTISIGRGTVHNRFLDLIGLHEVRKEIVSMIVEAELASDAMQGISRDMHFQKSHHGIAFRCPVSEFIGSLNVIVEKPKISEVNTDMYKAIYVVVDKGKAEDVVDAANKAGAGGATIINARGAGVHEVQKLFSIEIEPEKEKVLLVTKTETKDKIVESIKANLDIEKPGKGIIFVLDVLEAHGLHGY